MGGDLIGYAMLWALLIPAIGALVISQLGRWPNLRETVTLITAGALFIDVLWIAELYSRNDGDRLALWEMFPGLSLTFAVEPLGLIFALIASGLWIVTSVYSIGYMRGNGERNQTPLIDPSHPS